MTLKDQIQAAENLLAEVRCGELRYHGHQEFVDGEAAFAAFDIWSGVQPGTVVSESPR